MAEISKISKGGVPYDLKDTQGRAEVASLEERVFGKEVEWRKEESTYVEGLPFSLPKFEGLEAKKYIFTHDTADKSVYQVFDLTGMTVGETRNNGSVYEQGLSPNEYFIELAATMGADETVTVETCLYFADSIGDLFGDSYGTPIYCTEYFEPCLEERITALENTSGGGGGGIGEWVEAAMTSDYTFNDELSDGDYEFIITYCGIDTETTTVYNYCVGSSAESSPPVYDDSGNYIAVCLDWEMTGEHSIFEFDGNVRAEQAYDNGTYTVRYRKIG